MAYLELPNNPHVAFFGVYDGHAGALIVNLTNLLYIAIMMVFGIYR